MKKVVDSYLWKPILSVMDWLAHTPLRAFVLIFFLGFGIRMRSLMEIPPEYLIPNTDWELGAIAISLVKTGQFANPYMVQTGPTAHLPPLYPIIFAFIYHLFGLTARAGYVSMGFIITTNSIMYAILPWLGVKFGLPGQAGLIGGLAGAFMVEWSAHGEGLTGIFLGLILVAFLKRWSGRQHSVFGSLLLGIGIGATFHLQPVLFATVLGCLAFEIWWQKGQEKFVFTIVLIAGIVLACVPWTWRNYSVFHEFFFIRSNLGLELRMGNHDDAVAAMEVMDITQPGAHPRTHIQEALKLRNLGEVIYMQQALDETLNWIRNNPGKFLKLTGLRFTHFWFGPLHQPMTVFYITMLTILALLGSRRIYSDLSLPERMVVLIPLITYPVIYYFVPYMPRYRTPIDWILLILASTEIWHWIRSGTRSIWDRQAERIRR